MGRFGLIKQHFSSSSRIIHKVERSACKLKILEGSDVKAIGWGSHDAISAGLSDFAEPKTAQLQDLYEQGVKPVKPLGLLPAFALCCHQLVFGFWNVLRLAELGSWKQLLSRLVSVWNSPWEEVIFAGREWIKTSCSRRRQEKFCYRILQICNGSVWIRMIWYVGFSVMISYVLQSKLMRTFTCAYVMSN